MELSPDFINSAIFVPINITNDKVDDNKSNNYDIIDLFIFIFILIILIIFILLIVLDIFLLYKSYIIHMITHIIKTIFILFVIFIWLIIGFFTEIYIDILYIISIGKIVYIVNIYYNNKLWWNTIELLKIINYIWDY